MFNDVVQKMSNTKDFKLNKIGYRFQLLFADIRDRPDMILWPDLDIRPQPDIVYPTFTCQIPDIWTYSAGYSEKP